jgi:hypothetical protein
MFRTAKVEKTKITPLRMTLITVDSRFLIRPISAVALAISAIAHGMKTSILNISTLNLVIANPTIETTTPKNQKKTVPIVTLA